MASLLAAVFLVIAASARLCAGQRTVELALGVLGSFDEDPFSLGAIILADLDFRKRSEPDLLARFGPPILEMPNTSFFPGLRVRPVIADDQGQDAAGLLASNNFALGMKGYPKVSGLMGPTSSNVALATAPCSAAYALNQVATWGATSESLSDKGRFPYFFRANTPGSQQGRILWQYVDHFGFRGATLLCVLHESSQAVQQGFLLSAVLARRSEAVKGMTVPSTTTAEDADLAEWAGAVAFAKVAHNRLVIVLAPDNMAGTFLRYVPTHGICAPQYQLLMTYVVTSGSEWPLSMGGMHIVGNEAVTDSVFMNYVAMYLRLNENDILSGMERYGLDKWFNRSRAEEVVVTGVPNYSKIGKSTSWFNVFNLFVRAFGELLNQGTAPEDVGGELLRANLARADFIGVVTNIQFDASQDGMQDWAVMSIVVRDAPIFRNGVFNKFDAAQLAACRAAKAADGSTFYTMVSVAPQLWATGDISLQAPASLTACPPGQYLSLAGAVALGLCFDCPEGAFTNMTDQTECTKCPAGTRGDALRTGCVACTLGEYNPDRGSKECLSCMSGSVAARSGSEACELCPLGTYANNPHSGATNCTPCAEGLTTLQVASLSADACVCAAGTYRPLGGGPCAACGAGLLCRAGSEEANIPGWGNGAGLGPYPEALPMYYTAPDAPFGVYQCSSEDVCPGGPPGTCGPDQVGLACGDCATRHYRSPTGRCKACASSNAAPLSLAIIFAAVCVTVLAIYSQQEEGGTRQTLMTAVLVAGQIVACVQALSVIQQVKITWREPLLTVWQITGFVSFDMDLLRVACILGQDSPVRNFAFQLAGLPVVAILLGVLMILISRIRGWVWKRRHRVSWDRYVNLLGLLLVMVYISITVAMLRPLICKRHPNGLRSVASRMAVICWHSAKHRALIALSSVGFFCYPVALLATVAWATAIYPAKAATGSLAHLSRFKFVFARFRPACYYWGFWYLLRNLLIALVPVAVPDSGVWQMMMLVILFMPFMAMEAVLLPWRTPLANASEVVTVLCVLLFLQAAGFLVGASSGGSAELVSYLLLTIVLAMLLVTVVVLVYAVARTLYPGLPYSIFLCHHKEGAGSLARWLKLQVASVSRAAVFLDSDQLEELDLIVDTVRCRTKTLFVLLTRLTLSRIWCAAEIAAAVASKVPIVPLACCDYQPYTQEQLDNLGGTWSELQKHSVAQYGVHLDHIRKAYEHLAGITTVELRRFAPLEEQRVAAFRALHLCGVCGPNPPARAGVKPPACVAIIGAAGDAEARTTCEVLQHMVQVQIQAPVVAIHNWEDAQPHAAGAAYLLVVLTRGLIQDTAFTEVALEFDMADRLSPVEIVTALADANFVFPAAEVFEAMERQGGDQERLSKLFRRMFNILALPVSPHGSASIMAAQVRELCRRFKDVDKPAGVQRNSSTRSPVADYSLQAASRFRSLWRRAVGAAAAQPVALVPESLQLPAADAQQSPSELPLAGCDAAEADGTGGALWHCLAGPSDPVAATPPVLRMPAADLQHLPSEASYADLIGDGEVVSALM